MINLVRMLCHFGRTRAGTFDLPEGSLSRGFFYRLLQLVREHNEAARAHGKSRVWLMPKLAYAFGRTKPKSEYQEPFNALQNYVFSSGVEWKQLEVALLWFLMMMR